MFNTLSWSSSYPLTQQREQDQCQHQQDQHIQDGLDAQENLPEDSVCERGRVGSDCTCVFIKYHEFW